MWSNLCNFLFALLLSRSQFQCCCFVTSCRSRLETASLCIVSGFALLTASSQLQLRFTCNCQQILIVYLWRSSSAELILALLSSCTLELCCFGFSCALKTENWGRGHTHKEKHKHTHRETLTQKHIHTQRNTHTETLTHTHTQRNTQPHTHSNTHTHTETQTQKHTHSNTPTHRNTHTHKHTHKHTHTQRNTHRNTNTHTHTHTHRDCDSLACSRMRSVKWR
jgi:hypothetical protein